MSGVKKLRQSFNTIELRQLDDLLETMQVVHEEDRIISDPKTAEEIRRLRAKIQQMILQRRKVR